MSLHIFEERYRQLIKECSEEGKSFGIPVVNKNEILEYGTEMELVNIHKTYEEGEMDIKVKGVQIFRVLEVIAEIPDKLYSGAIVSMVDNIEDHHTKLIRELILPINSVSERMTVSQALDFFIKEKDHLALVTDEYGVVTGLVTLEDTVETLLGVEIVDEFDNITDMRQYALEQWQIRKNHIRKPS